ncbi:MAG: sensor histidine kinase [Deltaproteobacteria bacterium]|nr:MAG: sensor histidine kinase [Deltaproteobacteria bacterium]
MALDGIAPPSRAAPMILAASLVGAGLCAWAAQDAIVRHERRTLERAQAAALGLLAEEAARALATNDAPPASAATPGQGVPVDATDAKERGSTPPKRRKKVIRGKRPRSRSRPRRNGPPAHPPVAEDAPASPRPAPRPSIHDRIQSFLADHPTADGIRVRAADGALAFAGTFPESAYRREVGAVEVVARDPAGFGPHQSTVTVDERFAAASFASVALMGIVGLRLRRRLVRLSEVAHGVAAGRFDDLPALSGRDEFRWIADTLRDTADLVREQIERVHGRNAHLVRDLALQGDHLARLSRCAALLVSPVTGEDGLDAAFGALAEDTDAAIAVLFELTEDGALRPRSAVGIAPEAAEPSGDAWTDTLRTAADAETPTVLGGWDDTHPWMVAAGRAVPLDGVVAVPLRHRGTLEGLVVLATRHPLPRRELDFLADVARPFAIAMANRRAYRAQRSLACTLAERNDELLRQRDELRALDRLRKQFVANISHELRTPLGAVIGYAELLLDELYGPIQPDQREPLEGILETATHLLGLVNQVLDLSKAEHEVTPQPRACDLREIADEAVRMCAHLTKQRPYDIEVSGDDSVPLVTDPEYVRQVLVNLIGNAVKFTTEGHVRVVVRATPEGGGRVDVIDTGTGIAAEHLELVFEAFRQVDGSSTRAADGAGLGLAISRRIARRLGGELKVESALGQGSTFSIHLPAATPAHESELELAQEAA